MGSAVPRPDPLQWRFAVSSTLRGIYVIRYFLFSGGSAILGALIERSATGGDRPIAGLLIGFAVGLLIFLGQLRPLSWPSLAVSQEAVYLIRKGRASVIPWSAIDQIEAEDRFVSLRLVPRALEGESTDAIRLEPRKFGMGSAALQETLRMLANNRELRSRLPSDEQLRRALAIPPA
jgi:hypothetical protein